MAMFNQGHALIIGVGADLAGTVDDAEGLAGMLTDDGRCAYPAKQVQTLTGPAAERDALLKALDNLAEATNDLSTVIVYFSGHGYKISTSFGDAYFLLPYGYDIKNLRTTAISGAEFTQKLRAIPAQKLLLLLDCCHAGGIGEAKAPGIEKISKSPLPPEALNLLGEGKGRVVIASSKEDELSYAGRPYSAFTVALIEALSGDDVAKRDGFVRVSDVALHTREVVPRRTRDKQHPILHFEEADNFVLAYYAGGDTQPKGLPFGIEPVIEPEPGAWQRQGVVNGSGALAQGDHATALGAGAVQAENVRGDIVTGNKTTVFNQSGQTVHGSQTNIEGDVTGPVLSGQFDGPVAVGGGEAVDFRGSQGGVYKPQGPVNQHYGDRKITITGDGNIIGGNHNRVEINKQQYSETVPLETFLEQLQVLRQAIATAGLDADEEEVLQSDLRFVERQAQKPQPKASLILGRLGSIASALATADGVFGITERAQPLAQQLVMWAERLFK
ncbi:MAG: caspase family protein [Anaerolineae bacterium]|nr:caspase family protein [Anaerolineae bacterium]